MCFTQPSRNGTTYGDSSVRGRRAHGISTVDGEPQKCGGYLRRPHHHHHLGLCSPYLGLMSAHVAHILADVGPMLAQACPYLSLMLTHVAHILADVGPMLAPRPSRCPVFRSGPLPKTQNHEKPMVF